LTSRALALAERRLVPDFLVRAGMRRVIASRLRAPEARDPERAGEAVRRFVAAMRSAPIAVATETANQQHYELPAEFFATVLGPLLKYSACWWPEGVSDLAAAEQAMLDLSCRRARIEDGMDVLDLGCGWGSMSVWIARNYPSCRVLAVSNSAVQRRYLLDRCAAEGLDRVKVLTEDMNSFATDRCFDRVVSVEMFEHMRNWGSLFERIAGWLRPDGRFFQHVFCHRLLAYAYADDGPADWMARHFFTGGIMPSADLPHLWDEHLEVESQWKVDGTHYTRTLEAWLDRMDAARDALLTIFGSTYGVEAERWFARWRMFFMACSELFGYRGGSEWWVAHTVLRPISAALRA
jgi:cyclopropane-fatty-acyl-phospholipid synthase